MIRRPPRSTRTDTLFPYTTLFRSHDLDAVAPFVAALVVFDGLVPGFPARDAGSNPLFLQGVAEPVGIIAPVGQQPLGLGKFVEQSGSTDIVTDRSEEHTSELQSLMRISYDVFCLKKKKKTATKITTTIKKYEHI